jgi:hypothetical protein
MRIFLLPPAVKITLIWVAFVVVWLLAHFLGFFPADAAQQLPDGGSNAQPGQGIGVAVAACQNASGAAVPCRPSHPLGYCSLTITVSTGLAGCPGGIPAGATYAAMTVENNAMRWRDDGPAPTAGIGGGNPILANGAMSYTMSLATILFIPQTATATVNVNFYR